MKVNIGQVKNGFSKYLDSEFVQKLEGLKKWAVLAASSVLVQKVDNASEVIINNNIIKAFDIVNEDGLIDIDALKQAFDSAADKTGSVVQQVPLLGPVTFTKADIQKLYDYIIQS